jgi:predicted dehydrogenase
VTGYLGTVIATPETWRMQIFGSLAWIEVGDIEHLTTWTMRVCYVDPKNPREKAAPQEITFPTISTERAELEHFAEAAAASRPLAVAGGDEVHGVAVMEAIMDSIRSGEPVKIGRKSAPAVKRAVRKNAPRKTAQRRSKATARRRGRR